MTTNHRDKAEGHLEAARAMLEIEPDPEHPTMILATTLCRLEAALATVDALERIAARLTELEVPAAPSPTPGSACERFHPGVSCKPGDNHPAAAGQHTTAATSPRLARELLEERYPSTPPTTMSGGRPKAAW